MARRSHGEEYEDEYEEEVADETTIASWRRGLVVPLILILFGFGTWLMWKKYDEEVLSHASYRIDPNNISCTDPPEWLERDIRAEAVRLGSLESKKITDEGLSMQVAIAFEHHVWVKSVERVVPVYPGKLDVQLTYREPVAVVVRPFKSGGQAMIDYYPIDEEAVLLPVEDFSKESVREFPRINVGNTRPAGVPGSGWGDDMVADAAKIAKLLYDEWDIFKDVVYQIQRSSQSTSTSSSGDFDIRSRPRPGAPSSGLLVHWGRAPGKEQAGEPSANAKLAKLKELVLRSKSTTRAVGGEIDLRSIRDLQTIAKLGVIRR